MEAPSRAPSVDEQCGVHRPWARFNKAEHARGSQRFLPAQEAESERKCGCFLVEEARLAAAALGRGSEQKKSEEAPTTGLSSFASTADPFQRQQPRGSTGRVNDTGGPQTWPPLCRGATRGRQLQRRGGFALSPLRHLTGRCCVSNASLRDRRQRGPIEPLPKLFAGRCSETLYFRFTPAVPFGCPLRQLSPLTSHDQETR
ncbi:hypothetical protein MRX96_005353 [Rhipicephalus microplus]